jgi:hypothetical protein
MIPQNARGYRFRCLRKLNTSEAVVTHARLQHLAGSFNET